MMGPIRCPETSDSNLLTQRNNPEDGRIQLAKQSGYLVNMNT